LCRLWRRCKGCSASAARCAPQALLLDAAKPSRGADRKAPSTTRAKNLPLVTNPLPVPPGYIVAIYVSESMVDLYGAAPGKVFERFKGLECPK
jgi:hypothetical protein